jgi:MarR family transcriptional regulator, organic hydroperoxide resistance regulator
MTRLDTTFKSAEDSPGFMLWKAANLLQRLHSQCLADLNVTPTQFSLMTCVVYLDGTNDLVTATSVVSHTGMDKMLVSDLLKTLENKGLITRSPNPNDARSSVIRPTPLGVRTTNAAVRKIEAFDARFFGRLVNVPAFHRALVRLVRLDDIPGADSSELFRT